MLPLLSPAEEPEDSSIAPLGSAVWTEAVVIATLPLDVEPSPPLVTETELCYISRESVTEICVYYPELRARLHRFANAAKPMNAKRLKKAGLTRMDLQTFSTDCEYTRHVSARWPCAFFAACFPAAALLVC